ncbi:MAG: transglycosylase SLT domain-containing protein [Myxococcota bacterium]
MSQTRSILAELAFLAVLAAATAALAPGPPAGAVPEAAEERADTPRALLVDWFRVHSSALEDDEIASAADCILRESERRGLDAALVLAVIEVESAGDAFAFSSAGAVGLMQLRPSTAEATARRAGLDWRGVASLAEPEVNIQLGVAYLRELIDRFGSVEAALAAYNLGPSRLASRLARGDPMPSAYARRVRRAFGGPLDRGVRFL